MAQSTPTGNITNIWIQDANGMSSLNLEIYLILFNMEMKLISLPFQVNHK